MRCNAAELTVRADSSHALAAVAWNGAQASRNSQGDSIIAAMVITAMGLIMAVQGRISNIIISGPALDSTSSSAAKTSSIYSITCGSGGCGSGVMQDSQKGSSVVGILVAGDDLTVVVHGSTLASSLCVWLMMLPLPAFRNTAHF